MKRMTSHSAARFETVSDPSNMGLSDLAASFKLLADETRLRVLSLLIQSGELNVRTLCSHLDQSQPAVSHHLALLRDAGIIEARRDGKHNYYRCIAGRLENLIDGNWRGVMEQADCETVGNATLPPKAVPPVAQNDSAPLNGQQNTISKTDGRISDSSTVGNRVDGHEYLRAPTTQITNDAVTR